jgi:hypothetical protein
MCHQQIIEISKNRCDRAAQNRDTLREIAKEFAKNCGCVVNVERRIDWDYPWRVP